MTAGELPQRLAAGAPIEAPVAVVVAHPDDETLGLGSRLHLFEQLTLIHLTDGAPVDMGDARRAGHAARDAYAAARAAELDRALDVLGVRPARRLAYGFTDQTLVDHLPELIARLARDLAGHAAVITHAYEGGHPDHDAAALAVPLACEQTEPSPQRFEFAGYFGVGGTLHANRFHPDPTAPEAAWDLDPEERERKARAFAAHASQSEVLAWFPPAREAVRPAPRYDVSRAPPPGEAHYDRYGWRLDSPGWRAKATAALAPAEAAA